MRAAIVSPAGDVTNIVEVAPREMPPGAQAIPDGLAVAVGWTYKLGRFIAPSEDPEPPPPPTRNLEAEYAEKVDNVSTMAGLRQVMRDYFTERAASN